MKSKVSIDYLATGVPGLDLVLGGGLPEFSFNVIGGPPGSGKTTLAHQMMFSLANPQRPALYFTVLGEPPLKMLRYQQQFAFFDVDKIDNSVRFINVGAEAQTGDFDQILARIQREVENASPGLVFVDSFRSLVSRPTTNAEILSAQQFIQELGVHLTTWEATTFLIAEYTYYEADPNPNPVFTVADSLIWLTQSIARESMLRKMEIKKIRGRAQLPGFHTFRIADDGIQVFPRTIINASISDDFSAPPADRLSLGVPRLDELMGGGLPCGYSLLVTGPTGSGKSVLATTFLLEGARCAEPGVIVAFEKNPSHMKSATLAQLIRDGHVGVIDVRRLDLDIEVTLHEMIEMIERMQAKRVVIDSLSGFELALAPTYSDNFREALYRMVAVLTSKGMTVLMTSELEDRYMDLRFSPYGAAFLTDAVIAHRYVELKGELRPVITVVKVRASAHSRKLHLFEINEDGLIIGDPVTGYEGLLSGHPTLEHQKAGGGGDGDGTSQQ